MKAYSIPSPSRSYEWLTHKDQSGFGEISLATVIGETGDLTFRGHDPDGRPVGYPGPAQLWRRMGCAPGTFNGKTQMGATWKSGTSGKLSAKDWEAFGYCPRRRSIVWNIGESLLKQNGDGPYRKRFAEAKAAAIEKHPEWFPKCGGCEGSGVKKRGGECALCKGKGIQMGRFNHHGKLLVTSLLLKNLWIEWLLRMRGDSGSDLDVSSAAVRSILATADEKRSETDAGSVGRRVTSKRASGDAGVESDRTVALAGWRTPGESIPGVLSRSSMTPPADTRDRRRGHT
jgi:hypothetical protein